MNELYLSSRNYDLLSFWNNVCKDTVVRDLMLRYTTKKKKRKASDEDDEVLVLNSPRGRLAALKKQVKDELALEDDQDSLFATGSKMGTQELAGQRILQVATIVRNLSFEEDNAGVLAKNVTLLRYKIYIDNEPNRASFNESTLFLPLGSAYFAAAPNGRI